ncbi:fluoride efflux transporter CrcB [Effusibacillus lacus]|uniref:Fluoride-specific ion channel FluC n=1 Tax=Effusibacillus lacus TaxID=1348429 RepID=A0A292YRT2_9BACL|nr:fluoride efflux transporter CrcB [Effusibacillus lacus]TCS68947.1 camphor resistance protein CrcB [Effusibacillus lacus]GAX91483.1 camphor resistance protein CrcB [Effusibacillus lacus]
MTWILVAAGGALGAVARWQIGQRLVKLFPLRWPVGTFAVNFFGSFLLGWLSVTRLSHLQWEFLAIGVLGAFTTFSSFSYEAVSMWLKQDRIQTLWYILLTLLTSIAACWAGTLAG